MNTASVSIQGSSNDCIAPWCGTIAAKAGLILQEDGCRASRVQSDAEDGPVGRVGEAMCNCAGGERRVAEYVEGATTYLALSQGGGQYIDNVVVELRVALPSRYIAPPFTSPCPVATTETLATVDAR